MFCPSCNFQNLATSVRCMQCRTVLIEGSAGNSSEAKPLHPSNAKANAKGVAASLLGGAVGIYAGIHVLIPVIGAAATWLLGSKLVRPAQPAFLPAVSTQVGHALWLFNHWHVGRNPWRLNHPCDRACLVMVQTEHLAAYHSRHLSDRLTWRQLVRFGATAIGKRAA